MATARLAQEKADAMATPMTFTIPKPDLGEVAEHELGHDLTMLIQNVGPATGSRPAATNLPYVTYEVVDVRGAAVVHAAAVTHHPRRSVVSRWTLCSLTKSRRVERRRREHSLEAVNCTQCRRRLQKAGALPPAVMAPT